MGAHKFGNAFLFTLYNPKIEDFGMKLVKTILLFIFTATIRCEDGKTFQNFINWQLLQGVKNLTKLDLKEGEIPAFVVSKRVWGSMQSVAKLNLSIPEVSLHLSVLC